ncbi:Mob1/phocein [Pleomassaria siparia CBS 279.74]|uniref:Mob1/phocein n=1 Tax=Pleomassaria siparia CBS 279.74 TaxID=1314801 RepID=A0A6G1KN23_9PLEO|nr:Mob1/phocein [Pleomassaria siparia CBS 279.74]
MTASALSPSSSPRLPSPPPIAEDQLGPMSPIAAPTEEQQKLFSNLDHGAARRIRPGTKADDMAEGPPLVDLSEIDSAFQLTEHLKALHNFLTHPIGSDTTLAVDREMAHRLAHPPENIDNTLWLYELCRFLTQKVNSIITALFSDSPPCSSVTCPEMRASEWQYLCAVHDPPKSCCAIDYCCHTLDWAANTLTSSKHFPSRLALGNDASTQSGQSRQLTNIFRRVYRIFAHAWFQHRDMFWKVESRTGLYILFKTVCDVYGLIPDDNYTIPSEAEGIEVSRETTAPPLILRREAPNPGPQDSDNSSIVGGSDNSLSTAGTTVRHRHSPSVGATAVSTVVEEAEEEEESLTRDPLTRLETAVQDAPADADPDTPVPAAEDSITVVEEPSAVDDQVEAAEEDASPAEAEDSHIADAVEEQVASEVEGDDAEPHVGGKEIEDAKDEKAADETEEADEVEEADEAKDTTEVEAEEAEAEAEKHSDSAAEPEKANKDEATVETDNSGEVEEQGKKA